MVYSSFTLNDLKEKFDLEHQTNDLFKSKKIASIMPSQRLKADLEEGEELPNFSEKAKSELLIAPIIREIRRNNPTFTFFSGFAFNVDEETGLTGHPDFLLSAKTNIVEIAAPVFLLVEAKNRAIESAYGQCGAEMYAARLFNKKHKKDTPVIYGAVTTAFEWVFLKLENNQVTIDRTRYYLNEVDKLLGVFQWIVKKYK